MSRRSIIRRARRLGWQTAMAATEDSPEAMDAALVRGDAIGLAVPGRWLDLHAREHGRSFGAAVRAWERWS